MVPWILASASAAVIEVPVTVSLPVGEPANGALSLDVPLPSRIERAEPVSAEADGFGVRCSGRGRSATVELSFEVPSVPEHLPSELRCAVGSHTVVIQLHNTLEAAVSHPTLRAGSRAEAAFELPSGELGDVPGQVVDAGGRPVIGLGCRIAGRMLHVETAPTVPPGTYRCVVAGRAPIAIELTAD